MQYMHCMVNVYNRYIHCLLVKTLGFATALLESIYNNQIIYNSSAKCGECTIRVFHNYTGTDIIRIFS